MKNKQIHCISRKKTKVLCCSAIFLCCINYIIAQKIEKAIRSSELVVYALRYVPDSTNRDTLTATQALLLGDGVSVYGVYGNLNHDTANFYSRERGEGYIGTAKILPKPVLSIQYRILKSTGDITTYDKIAVAGSPWFSYVENKNTFVWSVKEDTTSISGIPCQRADCTFGNRNWIAWFAPSIPISDGPYKFCGLPGLILEIADDRGNWRFSMQSMANTKYDYPEKAMYSPGKASPAIITVKKQFMQLLKDSNDNGYEMEKQYGVHPIGDIEKIKKDYIERARKNNNWIELYKPEN